MWGAENGERSLVNPNPQTPIARTRTQNPEPRTHPLAGVKSFDDTALCMTQLITLGWDQGGVIYLFRGQTANNRLISS